MGKNISNRYENPSQGWQVGNLTFTDEELEKVDVDEIRELLRQNDAFEEEDILYL